MHKQIYYTSLNSIANNNNNVTNFRFNFKASVRAIFLAFAILLDTPSQVALATLPAHQPSCQQQLESQPWRPLSLRPGRHLSNGHRQKIVKQSQNSVCHCKLR
jgi:hypothetical protein